MILVQKDNVQTSINEKELSKYKLEGYVEVNPIKKEIKTETAEKVVEIEKPKKSYKKDNLD